MLADQIGRCADDLRRVMERGSVSLEEQVRAYDVLDVLMAAGDGLDIYMTEAAVAEAGRFCEEFARTGEITFPEADLKSEAKERLKVLEEELNEKRFEAAAAASLHEFAKEVFEVWQTSGIFARRRALRELRERAGFRLESHRIGNYVAKTYDLMNEAQSRFAKAQQAVFAADMTYKVQPGTYEKIYNILKAE